MVPQGTADRFECPNVFKLIMSALPRSTANIPSTCSHASHKYMYPTAIRGIVYSLCTGDLAPPLPLPTSIMGAQVVSICMLLGDTFLCTDNSFVPFDIKHIWGGAMCSRTYIVSFLQRVWCIGHTCRPSVWRDYSTPPSSLHTYP